MTLRYIGKGVRTRPTVHRGVGGLHTMQGRPCQIRAGLELVPRRPVDKDGLALNDRCRRPFDVWSIPR